ncbi:MAG: DUF456 domain-containing protein [Bacteroidia bacterium]|nr:DUF456 domain-containing protein [Bacteroidia bacterium]NNF31711.1 DUF456 domain-containing protein [Flavobacteriaceae bacterium]NNJ81128.1 DUF456 domain-containing protein [Flavobacteriaceae bacterium]NNK55225.1 DUF456 domain-containing protein [Flavobacteriaceae bacterium]NNM10220.1 DUF456 domain-containing protein [Flavobacteriaceae bacterium]
MDIILIIIGFLLMLIGIAGSILPVIPGTPISWCGLIVLYLSPSLPFDWTFIIITGIVAIVIYILDYIIPAVGTKKFGGSRAGAWGTIIGLFVGILAPIPFGILIGPFLGALVGEMAFNQTHGQKAVWAAFGSFVGFLASTFMKLFATCVFLLLFCWKVWEYRGLLF